MFLVGNDQLVRAAENDDPVSVVNTQEPVKIEAKGIFDGGVTWRITNQHVLEMDAGTLTGAISDQLTSSQRASVKEIRIEGPMIFPIVSNDMFRNFDNLTQITGLNQVDTTQTTEMNSMFINDESLQSVDLSSFNTSQVLNMSSMFENCISLKQLDLSNFNTGMVKDMESMFKGCVSLEKLNLANFNVDHVQAMSYLFTNCTNLRELNLTNFDTTKNPFMLVNGALAHTRLHKLILGENFLFRTNKIKRNLFADRFIGGPTLNVDRKRWINQGTGTVDNPKPTVDRDGISYTTLLSKSHPGNWVLKGNRVNNSNSEINLTNQIVGDEQQQSFTNLSINISTNQLPYVGSSCTIKVPQKDGYTSSSDTVTVTATDQGLVNDPITYTKIATL